MTASGLDEPDSTDRVLSEMLRLAREFWSNEDRRVERRAGHDPASTIRAAVELAGPAVALDGLIRAHRPLPQPWMPPTR